MNEFANLLVADWARRNITNPINVKVRFNSLPVQIFVTVTLGGIAIFLLALPVLFAISAVWEALTAGWSSAVAGRLGCGGTLFVAFGAMLTIPFAYIRNMRSEFVKAFTSETVETRGGRSHAWKHLSYVNHVSMRRRDSNKIVPNSFEIVFTTGKVIVPPLIENQAAIVELVNSIPAERRSESR